MQKVTKDSGNADNGVGAIGLLACFIVCDYAGLLNVTPAIPGWDQLFKTLVGHDDFKIRRFPTEWLYPLLFFVMMLVVTLAPFNVAKLAGQRRLQTQLWPVSGFGACHCRLAISLTYLIELEAVCLIDIFTGDRARLMSPRRCVGG